MKTFNLGKSKLASTFAALGLCAFALNASGQVLNPPPTNTIPSFVQQALTWIGNEDTNSVTFATDRGSIWTGAAYISGANVASSFGLSYNVAGSFEVRSVIFNAPGIGTGVVAAEGGFGYHIYGQHDVRLTACCDYAETIQLPLDDPEFAGLDEDPARVAHWGHAHIAAIRPHSQGGGGIALAHGFIRERTGATWLGVQRPARTRRPWRWEMSDIIVDLNKSPSELGISKQRLYQLRRLSKGLCAQCGKNPIANANHCLKCAVKQRERSRIRKGCTRTYDCNSRRLEAAA